MAAKKTKAKDAAAEAPPQHVPTEANRALVRSLSGYGIPEKLIAASIRVTVADLRLHYQAETEAGEAVAAAQIGKSLFDQAVGRPAEFDAQGRKLREELRPNVAAAIFLAKARLGFKEVSETRLTGPGGGPLQAQAVPFDLSEVPDDALAALQQASQKIRALRVDRSAAANAA